MRLLALDQASRTSGYAIFDGIELIKSGTIDLDDDSVGKRLHKLRQQIISMVKEYEITDIIFEDIQLQATANAQTYKVLAEVYGIIDELGEELNIPTKSIHASEWRSILNIKGRQRTEQKKAAQAYVAVRCNKKVSQDEADAICIGMSQVEKEACAF